MINMYDFIKDDVEIINLKKEKPKYPYDFCIDRRTPVGNPYPLKSESKREQVLNDYEDYFNKMIYYEDINFIGYLNQMLDLYKAYNKVRLFCWCYPKKCHGETIKKWLIKNKEN